MARVAVAVVLFWIILGSLEATQYCLDDGATCRSMLNIFNNQAETLDKFLKDKVEPTQAETKKKNQEVEKIVSALQANFKTRRPHTSAQIVKAGSLGKGTAIRGSTDIDLVVFLNALDDITELQRQQPTLLAAVQKELSSHSDLGRRLQQMTINKDSVKFTLDDIKASVRIASEAIRQQVDKSPQQVFTAMSSYSGGLQEAAQAYASSLIPLQVKFVKQAPGHVKGVMRLLKQLKQEKSLAIPDYSLELLAVYVSRNNPKMTSTDDLMRECLRALSDPASLTVAFSDNYDAHAYTKNAKAPYILDPGNPYVNTLAGSDMDAVSQAAQTICTSCGFKPGKQDL